MQKEIIPYTYQIALKASDFQFAIEAYKNVTNSNGKEGPFAKPVRIIA